MKMRIHAFISGKVQGVCFRQSTKEKADSLGLSGWAKNLKDGRVEVIAEGEDDKINKFIGFLHVGPEAARVEKVIVKKEECKDEFKQFKIEK